MKDHEKLSKYFCVQPFQRLEVYPDYVYTCCASWINTPIGRTNELDKIPNSEILKKVRESVLNGSYEYCNENECPVLSRFLYENTVDYPLKRIDTINKDELINNSEFTEVKISIDRSCNLSCPSCRTKVFVSDEKDQDEIKHRIDEISDTFGKHIKLLDMSGSGEIFASRAHRELLFNFDETKFPNLETIGLHTNANLLTQKTWEKMSGIHKYIKLLQISIDASTEETYNKVRRGGNWKTLMENVKFLALIPTIEDTVYLFVVQDINYKEMNSFVHLINSIPRNHTYSIYFGKIYDWGTFNEEEFQQKKIWDESHPDFKDFLIELEKTVSWRGDSVKNDMNDLISKYNLMGKRNII